jgi:hypothetical protein
VGAISLAVSDVIAATDERAHKVLPRGYWQEQPLVERVRVQALVAADDVRRVLDVLHDLGARRPETVVQDAEQAPGS